MWLFVPANQLPSFKRFHALEQIRYSPAGPDWISALRVFAELPALVNLDVSTLPGEVPNSVSETDAAVGALGSVSTLRSLVVPASGLTKAGLVPLLQGSALESLQVRGPVFLDDDLARQISRTSTIRNFEVMCAVVLGTSTLDTMIQGNQLTSLALTGLHTVRMSSALKCGWFDSFRADPSDASLRMGLLDQGASDESLAAFTTTCRLASLSMNRCEQVSDVGIASLANLSNLKSLSLEDTAITKKGSESLGALINLESLSLAFSLRLAGNGGADSWCRMTNLRHLYPEYSPALKDDFVEAILPLQRLEAILLNGCSGLTDAGVAKLAQFPNLDRTSLSLGSGEHESAVRVETVLNLLKSCPRLQDFDNLPDEWTKDDEEAVKQVVRTRWASKRVLPPAP